MKKKDIKRESREQRAGRAEGAEREQRAEKEQREREQRADLHRFVYNVMVSTDATETDIKEIESGIWKQKHKVKY